MTNKNVLRKLRIFIDFLKKHNLLPVPGGRTLDVGCGVGDYSLGLAKLGYQATGIDLSNGMIAGARKIAEKEDLDLDLYVGPWSETTREELGWERQFDLSYSFFCPVMFDMNNIEALTKTSRNACLFVGFAGRQDTIVDALYEHFYGQKDDFKWQANVDDVIATVKKSWPRRGSGICKRAGSGIFHGRRSPSLLYYAPSFGRMGYGRSYAC